MKAFFTLLMLAAVLLSPRLVRAEEQLPTSIRSAATPGSPVPKLRPVPPWHVTVGGAELKLDVAARRLGITMSLAL
jgi:hypothetical protein